jgi:hypothetical protein
VKGEPELEANLQSQLSSLAPGNQSEGRARDGIEPGRPSTRVLHDEESDSVNETEKPKESGRWDEDPVTVIGEQNLEYGEGYETSGQAAQHPLLDGDINDRVWPGGAKPEAQQAVTKLRRRGRGRGAQEIEIGDALSQGVRFLRGRISSGAQETDPAVEPGRDDGQSGAQEPEIGGAFSQGAHSQSGRIPSGAQEPDPAVEPGHDDEQSGAQETEIEGAFYQEAHSQSGRMPSGAQEPDPAVEPGRDDEQSRAQETEIGGVLSQGAQPIRENGQDRQWLKLKAILPKASTAWWNARIGHEGFTIKLRWRETDGQNPTLTFPRFMWEQFDINNRSDEEAKRIVLEWIAGHLHELVLDPEKRNKALIAAEKLGIDLNNRPPV